MRPEIVAHRGLPRRHPENSMPGFAAALDLGVDGIELDVQRSADGVPIVHHDPVLGRPAVPAAPLAGRAIGDLDLDTLRGHRLADGVALPTLAEVLALVDGRATVYVEVKDATAVNAVVDLLRGRESWTAVHAFDHRVPRAAHRANGGLMVGALSSSYLLDAVGALRAIGARDLWQHWSMIDEPLVEAVHAAGARVVAWTVNDIDEARRLVRIGVDALCSDVPDELARGLGG